jgi:sigma-B regulation protein RsbU (phosphoserine phosphatase)
MFGLNLPCRTVGGDYFDYFEYVAGKTAVLVGDVSGKGMPAAFLMSSLQARIQVLADLGLSPRELVARVNTGLCGRALERRFITFFFCTIDPKTGELVYTNAGHNPPLLIRANGAVETLSDGGLPLGLIASIPYEERQITFETGDTLILYSDGVTEACPADNHDDEFGEDRLIEFAKATALETAEATVAKLIEHVRTWTAGTPFADDVTVVCVKRV